MRTTTIALLALAGLAVAVPAASAHGGSTVNAKQAVGDAKALILTVDQLRPATGRLQFTIQPEGFTFKKVPYAGGKNAKGQGHAHIYAKADGARKAKYIGWTGSGTTSWTDKKMLKPGTTYRVFAVFSANNHTEDRKVMSNWVLVDF
jgi:hypothetical protein